MFVVIFNIYRVYIDILNIVNFTMIKEFKRLRIHLQNSGGYLNCSDTTAAESNMRLGIDFFKKNRLIFLSHHVREGWWNEFLIRLKEQKLTGAIIADHLPGDWARPLDCLVVDDLQSCLSLNLEHWQAMRGSVPAIKYKRNAKELGYSFFSFCGGRDLGRLKMIRQIELLGISRRALYSRAEVPGYYTMLDEDPLQLNQHLVKPAAVVQFDEGRNPNKYLHDPAPVVSAMQKCHFSVATEPNFDWVDGNASLSEKIFLSFLAGVPCVWVTNARARAVLEDWGFRDSSDGFASSPNHGINFSGCVGMISVLERLVMDSMSSQQWQDAQGERVARNHELMWPLNDLLHEQQWRQWQLIKHIVG